MAAAALAALPEDVLAEVFVRLDPRSLAASRGVSKAWRAAIDARRRQLCGGLLPRSLAGIYIGHQSTASASRHVPRFFARRPSSISGSLHFLPAVTAGGDIPVPPPGRHEIHDHCNGLLLLGGDPDPDTHRPAIVAVNPATRWCSPPLPPRRPPRMGASTFPADFLAYDPAASSRYEVLSVTCFRRRCSACSCCLPPPGSGTSSSSGEERVLLDEFSEWPPSLQTLDVYSSSTGRWEERTFHRQGEAARTTIADMRMDFSGHKCKAVYWQGALYVHYKTYFIMRFSLSDDKYQVIKMPTVRSNGHSHFCLGRSEKGVYLALITKPRSLQVWVLNESCDEMEWVPKHENNLDSVFPRQTRRRWMLLQDLDKKDSTTFRKEHDEEIDFEWSSDGDDDSDHRGNVPEYRLPATIFQGYHGNVDNNALGFGNFPQPPIPMFYHGYHGNIDVLGFHPYKEIVFLCEALQTGLAYHLKTSKMEILGKLPLVSSCEEILSNKSFTGVSLPYTPCWM
ncbi:uncharacterized protein LOC127768472 [Oryza glaberrima]|uniref:uncharacterized protein LOC127768472 n=1 Tax=Oryza glaberrima TaxID=4538 RepID=UPI00023E04D3|nr:uncharacterized protein LOC127768472 [Oryza glaberrima]